jgi:amino acid transporter
MPVSLAIGGLRLLLGVFYRQLIDTYPSAGGAYVVSRDNFGNKGRVGGRGGAAGRLRPDRGDQRVPRSAGHVAVIRGLEPYQV